MSNSAHFSYFAPVFHGKYTPSTGFIVGYAAIIHAFKLKVPLPFPISFVSKQNKKSNDKDWKVYPRIYLPEDHLQLTEIEALYNQLVFALKYEGINLLVFQFLIQKYHEDDLTKLVNIEPFGLYSRKIWFLIEWISSKNINVHGDFSKKSYVPLINENHQYARKIGEKSQRHRILNNLLGTKDFCPLISKTPKLESYIKTHQTFQKTDYLKNTRKDLLQRASAFLMLKDSKASFTIEGENPKYNRALRWGDAIGQAGKHNLSHNEFSRLQEIVIENPRFLDMGYRKKGGFVGEHDRETGSPIPEHISAKWQDIDQLMNGLLKTNEILLNDPIDAVLAAAIIAFGFVFIHPFEDGNGRVHRYIIHHILAKKLFAQQGVIFPVSSSILDHIDDYRKVLESYSHPILDFIEWEQTKNHNIIVLNETIDYYRYFDATKQAEFLYDCVNDTLENIIPHEINYLIKYDEFKKNLDDTFEMPDKTVSLLVRFLEQNNGVLSKRAKENEFSLLTEDEVEEIEKNYKEIFEL